MRKSRTQRRNKSKRKQKSNKNNKKASRRNHTIKKMRGGRRLGPDHQNQSRPVQKCLQDLADYWWNSELCNRNIKFGISKIVIRG